MDRRVKELIRKKQENAPSAFPVFLFVEIAIFRLIYGDFSNLTSIRIVI